MTEQPTARDRLLNLVSFNDAANHGLTPEQAVQDAISEALLNQPALRTCLVPGCLRQYDAVTTMTGNTPPRPEWDGTGWATLGTGTIFPAGGHICPDHKNAVTAHLPARMQLPNDRWSTKCACGWTAPPQHYHPIVRTMWEQHLLEQTGNLPPSPPLTDPEHRIPLAEHTDATLTELYDRLWDAEADYADTRETARDCMVIYTKAVPALMGAATSLKALRERIAVDSRDWAADALDAWLWALLVGWNCENRDDGHVHNDIDCAGDQGLWDIGRAHNLDTDQIIRAGNLRWWIANAITVADEIEEANK